MDLDVPDRLIVIHLETAPGVRTNIINTLRRKPTSLARRVGKDGVVKVEFIQQGVYIGRVARGREHALAALEVLDPEERVLDGLGKMGRARTC